MKMEMKNDSFLDNLKFLLKKQAEFTGKPGKLKFKKTPRILPPKAPQRAYLSDLRTLLNELKRVTTEIIKPSLESIISQAVSSRPRGDGIFFKTDDFVDDIDRAFNLARVAFYRKYTDHEVASIASRSARRTDLFNANQINKVFGVVLNIQSAGNEAWLNQEIKAFTKQNINLIKSIPDQFFNKVEQQITRAAQGGTLQQSLTQTLAKEFNVSESRAKLIARDQVSKFNSDLTKTRQLAVGIKKYTWSTSNDERVRPSHEEKEGKEFFWDDPPSDTGNPGEDINCRCVSIPVFE